MSTVGRNEAMLQGVGGFVFTKSDTVNLVDDAGNTQNYTDLVYTIYVGGDGDVSVETADGSTIVFVGLTAGSFLPMLVTRVNSTSTTATNMVAIKGS